MSFSTRTIYTEIIKNLKARMSSGSSCTTPSTHSTPPSSHPSQPSSPPSTQSSTPRSHSSHESLALTADENPNPPPHIISVNQLNYYVPQHVLGYAREVPVYQATYTHFGFTHPLIVALKQVPQEQGSYGYCVRDINKTRIVSSCNPLVVSVKEELNHQGRLWLAFEYAGPSLRSAYPQGASLQALSWILYNAVNCLTSIHQCAMIHGELNAGHIYTTEINGVRNFKIGFGATIFEHGESQETPQGFLPTVDICLWASPPEVYNNNVEMRLHTSASDMWQHGITAFELAWGNNLRVSNRADLEIQIGYAIGGIESGPNGVFLNANFQRFLSDCLTENPAARPTSQQLLNHDFFRGH